MPVELVFRTGNVGQMAAQSVFLRAIAAYSGSRRLTTGMARSKGVARARAVVVGAAGSPVGQGAALLPRCF